MKRNQKYFALGVLLCLCGGGVYAQSKLTMGPRAGMNFSTLTGVSRPNVQTNATGGVFFLYSSREYFGFSADLLYTGKGARYMRNSATIGDVTFTNIQDNLLLHYLELPILANIFLTERGNSIRPKIMLGPSVSYLMGSEETTLASDITTYNTFDFGVVAGLGANVEIGREVWLNIDGRYVQNFMNVAERKSTSTEMKNCGFSLSFGVAFGLGGQKNGEAAPVPAK